MRLSGLFRHMKLAIALLTSTPTERLGLYIFQHAAAGSFDDPTVTIQLFELLLLVRSLWNLSSYLTQVYQTCITSINPKGRMCMHILNHNRVRNHG